MLFFSKPAKLKDSLWTARSILRWARSSQEYVPWYEVDTQRHFKKYFDIKNHVLTEFEDEWSVIPDFSEFTEMYNVVWKRSEALARLQNGQPEKNSRLTVKFTQVGKQGFLLKPFLISNNPPKTSYTPLPHQPLELSMQLFFADQDHCAEQLTLKQHTWRQKLDVDGLEHFLTKNAAQILRSRCRASQYKDAFDSLIDILTQFDQEVLSSQQLTAQQYLKQLWQVPNYVFSEDPDQGMMTRLRMQRSFEQLRRHLYPGIKSYYLAELVKWVLFRPFNEGELQDLSPLVEKSHDYDGQQFIHNQLFQFYKKILVRCGVPVEIGYLYGTDVFLSRVTDALSAFPNQSVYALLLEETIRFEIKHSKELKETPEKILQIFIKIIVGRLSEFQSRKKQSDQELTQLLSTNL